MSYFVMDKSKLYKNLNELVPILLFLNNLINPTRQNSNQNCGLIQILK